MQKTQWNRALIVHFRYVKIRVESSSQRTPWGQKNVAIVEKFMFGLSAEKSGRSREVAVIGGSTVFGSEAWGNKQKKCFLQASEPSMNFNISKLVY